MNFEIFTMVPMWVGGGSPKASACNLVKLNSTLSWGKRHSFICIFFGFSFCFLVPTFKTQLSKHVRRNSVSMVVAVVCCTHSISNRNAHGKFHCLLYSFKISPSSLSSSSSSSLTPKLMCFLLVICIFAC